VANQGAKGPSNRLTQRRRAGRGRPEMAARKNKIRLSTKLEKGRRGKESFLQVEKRKGTVKVRTCLCIRRI